MHAWFDKHLKQKKINTGPSVELFMNDRKTVYQTGQWPPRPTNKATWFYLNPKTQDNGLMTLATKKVSEANQNFASFVGAPTNPLVASSEFDQPSELGEDALGWETDPFKKDTLLAGIPKQKLFATIAADPGTPPHVIATLYDVDAEGNVVCVPIITTSGAQRCGISKATFAMNPEFRDADMEDDHDNIHTPSIRTPVVPGPPCPYQAPACPHKMRLNTRGMAQVYKIEKGHTLRLVVATSQPDKPPTRPEGEVSIYMSPNDQSRIGVPVVRNARLRKDNFYSSGGADGS